MKKENISKADYLAVFLSVLIILPYFICCLFLNYYADDFSMAIEISSISGNSIVRAIKFAYYYYMNWQGCWFSMLIDGFSPLILTGGNTVFLRIVAIVNLILLVFSIYRLVLMLTEIIGERNHKFLCFFSLIFVIFNIGCYKEILYWYTGMAGYSIPFVLYVLIVSEVLRITFLNGNLKYRKVVNLVLIILCTGGVLQVVGMLCYTLLLILIIAFIQKRKTRYVAVCFVLSFVGAIFNAVAPGNYVRHSVIDNTGIHIDQAMVQSLKVIIQELRILTSSISICAMVIIIIVAAKYGHKMQKDFDVKQTIVLSLGIVLLPYVTIFPYQLGYSGSELGDIPNRSMFLLDFSLIISFMILAFVFGAWLSRKTDLRIDTNLILVLSLVLLIMAIDHQMISNAASVRTFHNIRTGYIPEYSRKISEFYDMVDNSDDEEIVFDGFPNEVSYFQSITYDENPDVWTNKALAGYYNKKRIRITYEQ
ncbi:DUF6056 family protein [Butyrivibrio fibrisolvens]|uniref:DUF6056 family protein n=1 Tax=Butyrivibrio fibrisolvens TaxID=831 RepID=UPI0003B6E35A|nr:DUF6056 family protein [Butyrivibrio fibrisolvens]